MDLNDDDEDEPTGPSTLSIFHEDILLAILSYVADVPFEKVDSVAGEKERGRTRFYVMAMLRSLCNSNLNSSPAPLTTLSLVLLSCPPTLGPEYKGLGAISTHSTLTHTLPLVSKQFHKLTQNHDLYWKNALLRLVHKEPSLWAEGMNRVIFDAECDEIRDEIAKRLIFNETGRRKRGKNDQHDYRPPHTMFESKFSSSPSRRIVESSTDSKISSTTDKALLDQACMAMEYQPLHHHPNTAMSSGVYQCIYRSIVTKHLRYQGPVFIMGSSVRLGSPYGLHFFEPRYRVLISEVMQRWPVSARRGERIHPLLPGIYPPTSHRVVDDDIKLSILNVLENKESLLNVYHMPTFIHAHRNLQANNPAAIVQVQICAIAPNGSADVLLKPIAYIKIERIWERESGTGGLYEAQGLRMSEEESTRYESWCEQGSYGRGDGRGWRLQLPIP